MTIATTEPTITEHEAAQVERANASSATPVVFVHGLWLLPSSWDRWLTLFEEAGYVGLAPGWPDDPGTLGGARAPPAGRAGEGGWAGVGPTIPRRSARPGSTLRCSRARGSARSPTTKSRSSAVWIAS